MTPNQIKISRSTDQLFSPTFVVILAAFCIAISVTLATAYPVSAKCPPNDPNVVCTDMRFDFSPSPLIAGVESRVVATWTDQRNGHPIANEKWLSERGSPVYLWAWDHPPAPEEWQTQNVQAGRNPRPTAWIRLDWNGSTYEGTFTPSKPTDWYFRLSTHAPVPGMKSDPKVGYSGPRYIMAVYERGSSWWVNSIKSGWQFGLAVLGVTGALGVFLVIRRNSARATAQLSQI